MHWLSYLYDLKRKGKRCHTRDSAFLFVLFTSLTLLIPHNAIAKSDTYTLFSGNLRTHYICRTQLNEFVINASQKFNVEQNIFEDIQSANTQEGVYVVKLAPKKGDMMTFSCRGDKLVVTYKFH